MLHPSYSDLMKTINGESEGDTPVVNSRYSIVLATAKRARQLVAGEEAFVDSRGKKPLSVAVEEMEKGFVTIEPERAEESEDVVPEIEDAADTAGEETEKLS
ncbi:MAG: DNA-directed RNA polymerase subunit omega [Lachnospiraceae bacterium]|nr:DNA-directed RNA polymerase subunit omega [Lachnospiraceae bacterium]